MPRVSINVMHEIVYGCVQLVHYINNCPDMPGECIYSERLRWRRLDRYKDMRLDQRDQPGCKQKGNRIEILWGPDYKDRCDYLVVKDGMPHRYFGPLPDTEEVELERIDRRGELKLLGLEDAFCHMMD